MNAERKQLIRNAVPTLFVVPNPPPLVVPQRPIVERQSSAPDRSQKRHFLRKVYHTQAYIDRCKEELRKLRSARKHECGPQIKRMVKAKNRAILRLRKRLSNAETRPLDVSAVLDSVRDKLTPDMCALLESQLVFTKRKVYTNAFKQLAIAISFKSTACYKFLSTALNLPPKRTVTRWLSHIKFQEGLDDNVFRLLKVRGEKMAPTDRIVTLLADEISLKQLVLYEKSEDKVLGISRDAEGKYEFPCSALVFMVTGVNSRWKQALAYYFSTSAVPGSVVMEQFLQCILKVKACGFTVVNDTSDQGGNFSSVVNLLGVTPERPNFIHDGQVIRLTPDPPHLIKSGRNALLGHNIVTPEGTASWSHLDSFYEIEQSQRVRSAPRLTDNHLKPPAFYGKMVVRWASQILSHSVAVGITTYVSMGLLPPEALATSKYCQKLNDIFDILNTSRIRDAAPFKSALTVESHSTFQFIKDSIQWLKSLKILDKCGKDVTSKFRWIDGLITALNSVKELVFHLQQEYGIHFLLTRRLCQDPLENYFSIIRSKGGWNSKPSCLGFVQAYKITQCT